MAAPTRVRAFDDADYQRRLEQREQVARVLTEHGVEVGELVPIDCAPDVVAGVLVAAEFGVEVYDQTTGEVTGMRPATAEDLVAVLGRYGVEATETASVADIAAAVEIVTEQQEATP